MNCPQCGAANPHGARACRECGLDLTPVDARATLEGTPAPVTDWPSRAGDTPHPLSSVGQTLPPGLEIGQRYHVIQLLGQGGMGAVYRVRDRELERDVALKLIAPQIARDPAVLARFKREIQLSSRITHKNVLRVYDLGETDGIKFLTMEYVEGEDLLGLIRREGRLPVPRLLSIFRQVCEGLVAAHEQGVVHRDLKPQNIMVDAEDHVYVTDFGIARSLAETGMTRAGEVMGTPAYMSPEQVKGEAIDHRSDVYSLGVILYELVTGEVPFTGNTAYEVMMQRLRKRPRPATHSNPDLPLYVQRILDRCLAKDAAERYQTVAELLADLDAGTFHPAPIVVSRRRRRLLLGAAGLVVLAAAIGGGVWLARSRARPVPANRPPVSVLIADFENKTGEPVFDGTLEPAFGIALEGASFITAYNRDQARKVAGQLQAGSTGLGEPLARLVAQREGIAVITAGIVERSDGSYRLSVRASDAMTGKPIVSDEVTAAGKDAVLSQVARLAARVRQALGDSTPEAAQLAAAETFSASSADAAHEYAVAQELQWAGKWDEAIAHYARALELDPQLGRAYAGLAAIYANQGEQNKAAEQYKLALARLDRMSEREKFRTRGGYYLLVREPDKAIEQFTELVQRYPADTAGIANLALAYFYRRDMVKALAEGRRAVEIYPKNALRRSNAALFALYAGEFETAEREAKAVLEMNPSYLKAYVTLALASLAQGRPADAVQAYKRLSAVEARGASLAALGLADLAVYEGRLREAAAILEKGVADDLARDDRVGAAHKLLLRAEVALSQNDPAAARAAATRALETQPDETLMTAAARVYVEAGEPAQASRLADQLAARLEPEPQAYANLIEGEIRLRQGKAREAIRSFREAQKLADTWLGRFDLGRAYLEAGAFTEADAELETCLRRRGEATAVFLDDLPSYRYLPPVYYYRGRAQQGLKSPGAAESYRTLLAIKAKGEADPLVTDAKARLGSH